LKAEDK